MKAAQPKLIERIIVLHAMLVKIKPEMASLIDSDRLQGLLPGQLVTIKVRLINLLLKYQKEEAIDPVFADATC